MNQITLQTKKRSVLGKKGLNRRSSTPIHLYGPGMESLSLETDPSILVKTVREAGRNTPVYVEVEGETSPYFTFIREIQRHPVTSTILHVDFLKVALTERMRTQVPIELQGEAPAVRLMDGVLNQALQAITVECLPTDIPNSVQVDIGSLANFEDAIRVSDISVGDNVTVIDEPDTLIARVNPAATQVGEEEISEGPAEVARIETERSEDIDKGS